METARKKIFCFENAFVFLNRLIKFDEFLEIEKFIQNFCVGKNFRQIC